MAVNESDKAGWEELRVGFHATYGGGHRSPETIEAFHHGMDTVINSMQASYPHPDVCRDAGAFLSMLRACHAVLSSNATSTDRTTLQVLGRASLLLAKHADAVVEDSWAGQH